MTAENFKRAVNAPRVGPSRAEYTTPTIKGAKIHVAAAAERESMAVNTTSLLPTHLPLSPTIEGSALAESPTDSEVNTEIKTSTPPAYRPYSPVAPSVYALSPLTTINVSTVRATGKTAVDTIAGSTAPKIPLRSKSTDFTVGDDGDPMSFLSAKNAQIRYERASPSERVTARQAKKAPSSGELEKVLIKIMPRAHFVTCSITWLMAVGPIFDWP